MELPLQELPPNTKVFGSEQELKFYLTHNVHSDTYPEPDKGVLAPCVERQNGWARHDESHLLECIFQNGRWKVLRTVKVEIELPPRPGIRRRLGDKEKLPRWSDDALEPAFSAGCQVIVLSESGADKEDLDTRFPARQGGGD